MDPILDKHTQAVDEPLFCSQLTRLYSVYQKFLLSKPNSLLALAVIERMWDFQEKSSDRITPRCLCVDT